MDENPLAVHYESIMLALCVWREAQGEPYEGQVAVAHVIRNRMADKRWPKTLSGVVLQPKQFSCFNAGDPVAARFPAPTDPSWIACCKAACATHDPSCGANHYHTVSVSPKWRTDSKVTARIGRHIFYRL